MASGSGEPMSPSFASNGGPEESRSPSFDSRRASVKFTDAQAKKKAQYAPMQIKRNWLLTYGIGYTGKLKVLSYDHDMLVSWGGIPGMIMLPSIFRLRKS